MMAFKYIHRNPVKIGQPISYWTSYNEYVDTSALTDTEFMLSVCANHGVDGRTALVDFLATPDEENQASLLQSSKPRYLDPQAIDLITSTAGVSACTDVANLDKQQRNTVISTLKTQGLTIRQISRLTGINRGLVQRAVDAS